MRTHPKRTRPLWQTANLIIGLLAVLAAGLGVTAVSGQNPPPTVIRITAVDDQHFSQVTVNVITLAPPGGPMADPASLSLRENGIPVAFTVTTVPVGVDVTFVIDANGTMLDVDDDSGQTRWQKVQATITRFAEEFMDPTGLDRVSIVLPDEAGENGRFLIQNETDPAAVAAAIQQTGPLLVNPTPLNGMMNQAITQMAGQTADGRYQAILLLTDAGQIHVQLPFDDLVQQAQTIDLPLFVAILGARADADEIFRANRLTEPTTAMTLHMPQPEAGDAIYEIWAQQGQQLQLQYESLQRQSGQYPISLNLGEVRDLTTLDLELLPPQIAVTPLNPSIQREGSAPDTPLMDLQPQRVPLPLTVSWPDGKPRALAGLAWTVNGVPQATPETLALDAAGQLLLDWDVRTAVSGAYEIVVQAADELGFTAKSAPAVVQVVEERPLPPTPTPLPTPTATPTPVKTAVPAADLLSTAWVWLLLGLGLVAALLLWRRKRRKAAAKPPVETETAAPAAAEPAAEPVLMMAVLEPFLGDIGAAGLIVLTQANTSIGRDTAVADLVLADASVARLHARILQQGDEYWLYDEGSAAGTFHNYGRVGLAPQLLQDGDQIGLGRVQFRFRLRPAASLPALIGADEEE